MKDSYKKQVALLLDIMPDIAAEENFAIHGGTAINLFHLNLPRLSVDVDLTFIPFSDNRKSDLDKIREALQAIMARIKVRLPQVAFPDSRRALSELKLLCATTDAMIKIEVNQINRGLISKPFTMPLCENAQIEFNRFCEARTVSVGQLWGGKINAALDRQHPRDMFDVRNLLNNIGLTEKIKTGFIFFLLCGKRPFHELLNPQRINQKTVFDSQFSGMSNEPFSYSDYEETRERVIVLINKSLSEKDKSLLVSFAKGEPKWDISDYGIFPAIRWKLLNINKLKNDNPHKYFEQIELLEKALQ
ncbi:MAG: nucleotidyl transferase AbiEii/AbiGii toxin family protein [Candidatus Symbiothrix sp.]|jgi:predicted nucleotidyltransferase component of viral defense system|nr:nucleotidyl transferase AbiEii/AbiGii toxin family protein [Candidatus Symbiothrix sp.]